MSIIFDLLIWIDYIITYKFLKCNYFFKKSEKSFLKGLTMLF
nr:MAG TPA: hypothetical protein [Caudoviricetes sp.]DAG12085.1 MAG TPA: hypothetical protein [Caudoviricetes sp.]